MAKTEDDKVRAASAQREKGIKRFDRAAETMVAAHSSSSSEAPPTDISDYRTNEETYSVRDADAEERYGRKMEDRDHRTREERKL